VAFPACDPHCAVSDETPSNRDNNKDKTVSAQNLISGI